MFLFFSNGDDDQQSVPSVPEVRKAYVKDIHRSWSVGFTGMQRLVYICLETGLVRESYMRNVHQMSANHMPFDLRFRVTTTACKTYDGYREWVTKDFNATKLPVIGLKVAVCIPNIDYVEFVRHLPVDDTLTCHKLFCDPANPKMKWQIVVGTVTKHSPETVPGKEDDLFIFEWDDPRKVIDDISCANTLERVAHMSKWMRTNLRANGDDTDHYDNCYNLKELITAVYWHRDLTYCHPDYSFLRDSAVDTTWVSSHPSTTMFPETVLTEGTLLGQKVATMFPETIRTTIFRWKLHTGVITHMKRVPRVREVNNRKAYRYAVKWDEEDAMKLSYVSQRYTHELWRQNEQMSDCGFLDCGHYSTYEVAKMISFYNEKVAEGAVPLRQRDFSLDRMDRILEHFGDVNDGIYSSDDSDYDDLIMEIYSSAIDLNMKRNLVRFKNYRSKFLKYLRKVKNYCPLRNKENQCDSSDHVCDKMLSARDMFRNCFSGIHGAEHMFVTRVERTIIVMNKEGFVIDPFTGKVTTVWIEVSDLGEVIDIKFESDDVMGPQSRFRRGNRRYNYCPSNGDTMWSCVRPRRKDDEEMCDIKLLVDSLPKLRFESYMKLIFHVPTEVVFAEGELLSRFDEDAAHSNGYVHRPLNEASENVSDAATQDPPCTSHSSLSKTTEPELRRASEIESDNDNESEDEIQTILPDFGVKHRPSIRKEIRNLCVKHRLSNSDTKELVELAVKFTTTSSQRRTAMPSRGDKLSSEASTEV